MKNILITGATGFVGRQILRELANSDVKIFPIVRTGKESKVSDLPKVESIISSQNLFAEDESWWARQCSQIETIIHAAWYAEPGRYLQSPQNMDCLAGSLNLAKGAAKTGVKRVVGIGTCFEYDLTKGILSIDTPLKPSSPYAAAKAALYLNLSHWLPTQSISFAWCRLFYLYGEGEDDRRLVPYIRKQLKQLKTAELTNGNQIRDYLDVAVAGSKIAEVAMSEKTGAMNICSGIPVTVRQLAEQVADEYGRRDLLRFGNGPKHSIDPPCVLGCLKSEPNQKQ